MTLTPVDQILSLAQSLIRYKSTSGNEPEVMAFVEGELQRLGWKVERIPIPEDSRWNILACKGHPTIVLTTHLDVVPAPEKLFNPRIEQDALWGRGACDAKGIAATMIVAAENLAQEGVKDIGLLFVVDEEVLSVGAKAAAPVLAERGTKFIINGEPTDEKLVSGHKGAFTLELRFKGKSAHSGYPELGEDANKKLFTVASRLLAADFGSSEALGKVTLNIGVIDGGVAANVISPSAKMRCLFRTVTDNDSILSKVEELAPEASDIKILGNSEPIKLTTVPGFETITVNYGTDVPHLMKSGANCLLYGPGSIAVAHTDDEHVKISDLEEAYQDYKRLVKSLSISE